mgnify:CR=1 FL=1
MEQEEKQDSYSKKKQNPYNVYYENYLDTNACTECTGLMPRVARDSEQWNAFRDVFDFTAKPPSPTGKQD